MTRINIFYTWPATARSVVSFFFAICVLSQTLTAILSFYRQSRTRVQIYENVLELLVLAQVLVCSMLFGQVIQAGRIGLIPTNRHAGLRIVLFALITVLVIITFATQLKSLRKRLPSLLSPLLAAYLTLPSLEALAGKGFAYIYLAAILFWFIRSISVAMFCYRDIKANLSALSIKIAMDSLHTGVVFCEEDGFILLANMQMQQLMIALTGAAHRNGRYFYELLTLGEVEPGCEISRIEGQSVYLLPNGTAWKFSAHELHAGRNKYFQLTAAEVTERWKLTALLRRENDELLGRQKELNKTISNLHTLTREIETQKAKMRTHDIIGERLSLLLRSVRGEQNHDLELLRISSHGLIDDLKNIHNKPLPQDEIDSLTQTFGSVGVEILLNGKIPVDIEKGQLIVDIVREAITNAVRHGFATQVCVKITDSEESCKMQVTDNGRPPSGEITEGGGIRGMRKKVESSGGTVIVTTRPRFVLTVELVRSAERKG